MTASISFVMLSLLNSRTLTLNESRICCVTNSSETSLPETVFFRSRRHWAIAVIATPLIPTRWMFWKVEKNVSDIVFIAFQLCTYVFCPQEDHYAALPFYMKRNPALDGRCNFLNQEYSPAVSLD